ncbi:hypothetical protein CKO28_06055 [Rhodovibrio sodomensis]|uniref:Uncharacterized protein n=1 Tax=Rhodovibrio sodomensis TaxID=1088 RepID=A0ABS1DDW0_9PROT|nr:hypothetical protein [Rhodovibrio sodomensis]MBK1667595.1 hypothetical protein [Rhodovibrio sodomensis]
MIEDTEIHNEMRHVILAVAQLAQKSSDRTGALPAFDSEVSEVDPTRAEITSQLLAARDFAFQPGSPRAANFDAADLQDIICYVEALPPINNAGEPVKADMLKQVRLAADARAHILHLECPGSAGDFEDFGGALTVGMIAAIGQVSERSVRNAVSRGELKPTGGAGDEPYYRPEDAYKWLTSRRAFVPWPSPDQRRRQLHQDLLQTRSRREFARIVAQLTDELEESSVPRHFEDVRKGAFGADVDTLGRAADYLEAPDPAALIGHAVTLALREQTS